MFVDGALQDQCGLGNSPEIGREDISCPSTVIRSRQGEFMKGLGICIFIVKVVGEGRTFRTNLV